MVKGNVEVRVETRIVNKLSSYVHLTFLGELVFYLGSYRGTVALRRKRGVADYGKEQDSTSGFAGTHVYD